MRLITIDIIRVNAPIPHAIDSITHLIFFRYGNMKFELYNKCDMANK